MWPRSVIALGLLVTLGSMVRGDELEPILGRPWQPMTQRQRLLLRRTFTDRLNQKLMDCWYEDNSKECRENVLDAPMDLVYRVHPNRW